MLMWTAEDCKTHRGLINLHGDIGYPCRTHRLSCLRCVALLSCSFILRLPPAYQELQPPSYLQHPSSPACWSHTPLSPCRQVSCLRHCPASLRLRTTMRRPSRWAPASAQSTSAPTVSSGSLLFSWSLAFSPSSWWPYTSPVSSLQPSDSP